MSEGYRVHRSVHLVLFLTSPVKHTERERETRIHFRRRSGDVKAPITNDHNKGYNNTGHKSHERNKSVHLEKGQKGKKRVPRIQGKEERERKTESKT